MFPVKLNKNVIIEKKIFKDFCYIFDIDSKNIELVSLNKLFITKKKYRNLQNENNLKLMNKEGETYHIEKFYYDENFELNIDLKEEDLELSEIKNLLLIHMKKYINEENNPISKTIYNNIKKQINESQDKKYIFNLLDKDKDISKKDFDLNIFNNKVEERKKETKSEQFNKIAIISLLLFLSYVVLSSLIIVIGIGLIVLFYIGLYIYKLLNTDNLTLKESSILINEYRCSFINSTEKVLVKEEDYVITKEQINKIKLRNGRIDLVKVVNENHLPEIKKSLKINLNNLEKDNKNSVYQNLIKNEINVLNNVNDLNSLFLFFHE